MATGPTDFFFSTAARASLRLFAGETAAHETGSLFVSFLTLVFSFFFPFASNYFHYYQSFYLLILIYNFRRYTSESFFQFCVTGLGVKIVIGHLNLCLN
jgi:hypothetical protein